MGTTVVMVSHRQGALPLVDHLIIMEAGRIRQQGPKAEIIAQIKAAQEQPRHKPKQRPHR